MTWMPEKPQWPPKDIPGTPNLILETVSAKRDAERWAVVCLVQDLFAEGGKKFRLIVTIEGEILEVEMFDESPI
ncbi:MAG: hypothetical protein WBH08_11555 [Methanothrix sp.]|uniref:hypothetical protein n=1 Tax=Methanothrix sp. TaxID=90426 RepID=UPI003BB630BB